MIRSLLLLVTCGATAFGARAEDSFAQLRSGARMAISDVSPAGVTIAEERGRPSRVESLSQVRAVTGPLALKFEEQRALATDLWRASARLSREDEGGAEPLFEKLWTRTSGVSGPTRAEVASGLAACRAHRGAFATAVEPWTEWVRQAGQVSPEQLAIQRSRLGISEGSGIWIEAMPPIWTDSTAVRGLAAQAVVPSGKPVTHPTGDDLVLIYTVAARRDTGQAWGLDPSSALKDPGWANLAGEMVLAESEDPMVRAEARQRLSSRLASDVPMWKQIWIRLALGRSLLLEPGADERRSGILNLFWIASRPADSLPLGAGVSLALVSAAHGLVVLSDFEGARAVLEDLERRFVGDVILDSPGVAAVRRALAQVSAGSPAAPVSAPTPTPDSSAKEP
ncbi:MAG: hypothetical protein KF691_09940 [Phycisphaeraceae bacterium]|nr:hypothetical protein [Phycisphaeraceae bacterium]